MAPLSGMIGVTYDVNAIKKWTLTAHFKAAVRLNVRNLCKFASNTIDNAFSKKTLSAVEQTIQNVCFTIVSFFEISCGK